jgi:hypothetical protein
VRRCSFDHLRDKEQARLDRRGAALIGLALIGLEADRSAWEAGLPAA